MEIIEQDSAQTKSSLRTLPLVGSFKECFVQVIEAQALNKEIFGNCYAYDEYVFVDELGERLNPVYLIKTLSPIYRTLRNTSYVLPQPALQLRRRIPAFAE